MPLTSYSMNWVRLDLGRVICKLDEDVESF